MNVLRVGTALDTNGQGYRYAAAAERWGNDPDVLKALVAGLYDPADVAGRFREAAKKLGGISIRSAHVSEAYFEFPRDIRWSRANHRQVQELADEADVIHLNNSDMAYRRLRMHAKRKPALLHHHGTSFRNDPKPLMEAARRFHMVQAVSTIDLQRVAPELLHWLPTAYDLAMMAAIRHENRRPDDGMVRIVTCPTNREIKSTDALEAAVAQLQAEGLPVELVVVTNRPWVEALAVKATADIYFDQVGLGYGCNAVEAWGMGLPVVAGADEWTLAQMRKEWNVRTLPFYEATEATIADRLRELVNSADLRGTVAARGKRHAAKYHAEKNALVRLAELYGMAIRKMESAPRITQDWEEFAKQPGTFRSQPRLSLRIANQNYRFDHQGLLTISHARHAQAMRRIMRFHKSYGITEVMDADGHDTMVEVPA